MASDFLRTCLQRSLSGIAYCARDFDVVRHSPDLLTASQQFPKHPWHYPPIFKSALFRRYDGLSETLDLIVRAQGPQRKPQKHHWILSGRKSASRYILQRLKCPKCMKGSEFVSLRSSPILPLPLGGGAKWQSFVSEEVPS